MYEFQKQFPSWNFLVPREELFSSSGGTLRSLRGDFSFPTVEKKISKGGKESFQGRKIKFPALEIYFSKAGKFLEISRGGSLLTK